MSTSLRESSCVLAPSAPPPGRSPEGARSGKPSAEVALGSVLPAQGVFPAGGRRGPGSLKEARRRAVGTARGAGPGPFADRLSRQLKRQDLGRAAAWAPKSCRFQTCSDMSALAGSGAVGKFRKTSRVVWCPPTASCFSRPQRSNLRWPSPAVRFPRRACRSRQDDPAFPCAGSVHGRCPCRPLDLYLPSGGETATRGKLPASEDALNPPNRLLSVRRLIPARVISSEASHD